MTDKETDLNERVRADFTRQKVMELIGARMSLIEPGVCEIEITAREDLTQQNGFMHAGIVTTVLDSACGYAAFSLMPAGSGVLSVEFKVNLLAPAKGEKIRVHAEVKRAGRTLTVCSADAWAVENGESKICATMLATMIRVDQDGMKR
ncbi:MAG TPA: PaaI family thioesterase [Pyrinomonadaceae bacterium]|jgi:uncharacterized protein (TIGR00369 family)|nr:PaaI family thioesterase [Pyrinomonadaceae bacterium]